MATILWVGEAQAVPDWKHITITGSTAGTAYGFDANERQIRYTARTGDTTADVTNGILAAAQTLAQSDPRIRELTVELVSGQTVQLYIKGPADGTPIVSFGVTTGVTNNTAISTATGPYHADNVTNYSSGTIPTTGDTLVFSGLTAADGPRHALTAITATLAVVDVDPTYAGRIGLPQQSQYGYTEFRTRAMSLETALLRIRSNTQDSDERFVIDGGAVAVNVQASGAGVTAGVYPLRIHNVPAGTDITCTGYGVKVAGESGQTATLDTFTALQGSSFYLSANVTTAGDVLIDSSAGIIDCVYADVIIRERSNVLGGPNASCSNATGIHMQVQSGTLDWRGANEPAEEIVVGTGATFDTRNAIDKIAALTAIHAYEGATINNKTGRLTFPQLVNCVNCAPESVNFFNPENTAVTFDEI